MQQAATPRQDLRYHELDALRAFAMLIVVAFHCASAAQSLPEAQHGAAQAGLLFFVNTAHAFQMPVFFLMAGFFGALAVSRSGPAAFARGRLKRIGVPMVVFAVLLVPLGNFIAAWGHSVATGQPLHPDLGVITAPHSHHLWFLWYLLLYCGLALLVRSLGLSAPSRVVEFVAASRLRLLVLVPLTAALIWPSPLWIAETPKDWGIHAEPFLYNGAFFAFGWLLFGARELLPQLRRRTVGHTLVALAAAVAVVVISFHVPHSPAGVRAAKLAVVLLMALLSWTAIFALMGWFHRWFGTPSARVRFVADSAYWIYLMHLPLVMGMFFGLTELGTPLLLRVTLTPVAVSAFLMWTYARYGVIGRFLNGPPRRPSDAPAAKVPAAQPQLA